jgi:gluconate kinase
MRRPASRRCRPASPHSTDRAGWLARLAEELAARPAGTVLSCSALKRAYRDGLRAAVPQLRFAAWN